VIDLTSAVRLRVSVQVLENELGGTYGRLGTNDCSLVMLILLSSGLS